MGIKDLIKKYTESKQEKSKKFKEMQEDDRLREMLEERKKSANERELEKIMKQKREDNIKIQLDKLHKEQNKEFWSSKKKLLDKGTSITKTDRPILKEKGTMFNSHNQFGRSHFLR